MPRIDDTVIDGGLTLLDTAATTIWICSQEPTSYGDAGTYGLGYKSFAAGAAFDSPTDHAGSGRQVASTFFNDGEVTDTGTATHWAVTTGAALYATGELDTPISAESGGTFELPSFLIAQLDDGTDVDLGAPALDNGLDAFALANKIHVCSTAPTSYAQVGTYSIGVKDFGIGNCFGSITDYANGRKISSVEITDGEITVNGTPACWAVVDDANSRLLAVGNLSGATAVSDGDVFGLASFTIDVPSIAAIPNWWLTGAAIDLGFAENKYFDGTDLGAAVTDYLSCTRAQTVASYAKNSAGEWVEFSANELRITDLGLLVEKSSTNYLINSGSPVTQTTESLGTGSYTLWVEGTGSALASGGTATITGAASASEGSPNTFSVTVAGTVTVTITGSVAKFQLEGGNKATSFIPTGGASATRAVDVVRCIGDLETLLAALIGTAVFDVTIRELTAPANYIVGDSWLGEAVWASDGVNLDRGGASGYSVYSFMGPLWSDGIKCGQAWDYNGPSGSIAACGLAVQTSTSSNIWHIDQVHSQIFLCGYGDGYGCLNGIMRRATFWNSKITDAILQGHTAP